MENNTNTFKFWAVTFTYINRVDHKVAYAFGTAEQVEAYKQAQAANDLFYAVDYQEASQTAGSFKVAALVNLTTESDQASQFTAEQIATYHYYLCDAVLKALPEGHTVGDLFGLGEDEFISEMYQYSKAFYLYVDQLWNNGAQFSGVVVYDVCESLADLFVSTSAELEELPELDAFKLDLVRVMDDYTQDSAPQKQQEPQPPLECLCCKIHFFNTGNYKNFADAESSGAVYSSANIVALTSIEEHSALSLLDLVDALEACVNCQGDKDIKGHIKTNRGILTVEEFYHLIN